MRIAVSTNGKYLQVKDATPAEGRALTQLGFRWCGRNYHHWCVYSRQRHMLAQNIQQQGSDQLARAEAERLNRRTEQRLDLEGPLRLPARPIEQPVRLPSTPSETVRIIFNEASPTTARPPRTLNNVKPLTPTNEPKAPEAESRGRWGGLELD